MSNPRMIYLLLDAIGRPRWVGCTKNIRGRLKRHVKTGRDWIASAPIIEWVDDDNWESRERFWIAYGRNNGWPLENRADGGKSSSGWRSPEEFRAGISARQLGRKRPELFREKMRAVARMRCAADAGRRQLATALARRWELYRQKKESM